MRLNVIVTALGTMFLSATLQAQQTPKATPTDETLGLKPPAGATVLVGDKLADWLGRNGQPATWTFEDGVLTVKPGSGDIVTKQSFPGNWRMHVEFQTPYMPNATGQGRGNSGVYLQGRYELQVLDSYGLDSQDNDCGGIYHQHKPKVNVCKPPLQWQTYDIDFTAPKLDGEKVVEKAKVTIKQNGVLIHENAEIEPTPGGTTGKPGTEGPLLLQDHGNLVQYRNIWVQTTPGS